MSLRCSAGGQPADPRCGPPQSSALAGRRTQTAAHRAGRRRDGGASGARPGGSHRDRRCSADWGELAGLFSQLTGGSKEWPSELVAVQRWYQPHLERRYDDAEVRWRICCSSRALLPAIRLAKGSD